MPDLNNSKVYRGGVTAPYLNLETRRCTFNVNTRDDALDLRFKLASKGGGTTSVLLQVGKSDLSDVLEAIAQAMPEMASIFSTCASIANGKNIDLLAEARRVKNDEKARAVKIVEDLESVEEFVSEKYYAAPAGEDEREAKIREKLEEVISSLNALT